MHLLPTTLAAVADIAEKRENTRYAVTGVHLELKPDGAYRIDATDTKFLLRVTGKAPFPVDECPELPGMKDAPNGACKGLVPATVWRSAFSTAAKVTKRAASTKPILGTVQVKLGKDRATFGCTNLDSSPIESTALVEGRFPPVDQFVPKRRRFAFRIDGHRLATLMKAMTSVTPDEDENGIDFYLAGGLGNDGTADRIILERANRDGVEALGLIVPLVKNEGMGLNPITIDGKEECVRFLLVDGAKVREEDVEALAASELKAREEVLTLRAELESARVDATVQPAEDALQAENRHMEIELSALREENQRLRDELACLQSGGSPVQATQAVTFSQGLTRAERLAAMKGSAA